MTDMVPIAHFERKYLIAPKGAVWNLAKEKWQVTHANQNGYVRVQLSLNGVKSQQLMHILVAKHFLPNPYDHPQVNHKDGNKENNSVSNLEWISREGNIQHSLEIGLRKGYLAPVEKEALLGRVLSGELIRTLASEIGRAEESLCGMLRRYAEHKGRLEEWQNEMRKRRTSVALRNIGAWNDRDTEGS